MTSEEKRLVEQLQEIVYAARNEIWHAATKVIQDERRAAYANGWRAGAEAMRGVFWQEAERLNWSPSASVRIKTMPLPEPPKEGER